MSFAYSNRGRRSSGRGRGYRGRGRGNAPRRSGNKDHDVSRDFIEVLGTPTSTSICVAVEGCSHGELDSIYERLDHFEQKNATKIDLLICCGDFQSLRNMADFHSLAVPPKYRALGSFHRYYSGEAKAPYLTLFVGGNHEASQPLSELHYGGWVAPNIYFMGAAGVVNFGGLRIGGISGIYKSHDYPYGRYETPPYDRSTVRSVYHTRSLDVHRMKCLAETSRGQVDIMVSHDWPRGIEQHGDTEELLRKKPFFKAEVKSNSLGSLPNEELCKALQPKWWFAAHLHVKFKATMHHQNAVKRKKLGLVPTQVTPKSSPTKIKSDEDDETSEETVSSLGASTQTQFVGVESTCGAALSLTRQMTQFLSLDKCLPYRQCLSVLHITPTCTIDGEPADKQLRYDPEWLAVMKKTHHLASNRRVKIDLPREPAAITDKEVQDITQTVDLLIHPESFVQTVPPHTGPSQPLPRSMPPPLPRMGNPQTDRLLHQLGLDHVVTVPYQEQNTADENEIDLDEAMEDDPNSIDIDDGEAEESNIPDADENEIDLDDDDDTEDATERVENTEQGPSES